MPTILEDANGKKVTKGDRKLATSERALRDLDEWMRGAVVAP
jgi:hypothetical protein